MYTMMVAAMKRNVIAVDIMKQNIDFIKTSLRLMNLTGKVEFVLNAISDKYETLYPVFEDEGNGGSSMAVNEIEGSVGTAVTSVSLPDILSVIPSSTYIIKTDIQGYDCRALSDERLYTSDYFIPFIFMEWDPQKPMCSHVGDVLTTHGYQAFAMPDMMIDKDCLKSLEEFPIPIDIIWIHKNSNRNWIEPEKLDVTECSNDPKSRVISSSSSICFLDRICCFKCYDDGLALLKALIH